MSVNQIALVPREPIPALRDDLEVQYRSNGSVDVRDPHLLQIYSLDADDFGVARAFDGRRDAAELERTLSVKRRRVTTREIEKVAEEFDELRLLDRPEVWDEEPNVDNVSPYSQIDTKQRLKVLPIADESARWACHGCGACCHGLAVEISKEEESRIDAALYQDILRGDDFAEDSFLNADEPAKRVLRQREDDGNACIFLAADGLCHVHARQGMEAKPDACQMFPAMVMVVPGGGPPRLGLRTNCASMWKSFEDGPPVSNIAPQILRVVGKGDYHKAPKRVRLFKRSISFEKLDRICRTVRARFEANGVRAEAILEIDRMYLGGRVRKGQRRYGKLMLDYLEREASGPAPVEEGDYGSQIGRLRRGRAALEAMKAGKLPPRVRPRVERFLVKQIAHVMYVLGPLNLPDAGYALVGMMFGLASVLHAVGEQGSLKTANTAFEVFLGPLLETMEHSWPILDTIDETYARRLREEL